MKPPLSPLASARVVALALLTGFGCSGASVRASRQFQLELRARSDDGRPLSGVLVTRGAHGLGRTGDDGLLATRLSGDEGQAVTLAPECPLGYQKPIAPLTLRLSSNRALTGAAPQVLRAELVCQRERRDVVLAVHAPGGGGLAIDVNGQPAGITDLDGNAHVLVSIDRSVHTLEVAFSARDRKDVSLQQPRQLVEPGPGDTVVMLAPALTPIRQSPKRVSSSAQGRHVPTRID
jgi:hypothetical protein